MYTSQLKKTLADEIEKLEETVKQRMETFNINRNEVMNRDPFLAGQAYALGMVALKTFVADGREN